MTDTAALAAALGKVPSGLFVLTAKQGDAETAMLASWVQQCSFDPPQLTWRCSATATPTSCCRTGRRSS